MKYLNFKCYFFKIFVYITTYYIFSSLLNFLAYIQDVQNMSANTLLMLSIQKQQNNSYEQLFLV